MQINFGQKILISGEPLVDEKKQPISLGLLAYRALDFVTQAEANLSGSEKLKRGLLALKVQKDEVLEVSAEEISLIKEQIGKFCNPVLVAICHDMLENLKKAE